MLTSVYILFSPKYSSGGGNIGWFGAHLEGKEKSTAKQGREALVTNDSTTLITR